MIRRLLFAAVLGLPVVLPAQRQNYENFNGWFAWFGDIEINPKWSIDFDTQLRGSGPADELAQVLWRASLRRNISSNVRVAFGYAGTDTHPYGKLPIAFRAPEHRIFEQLQLTHGAGRVQFTHRYRLEQRWSGRVAVVAGDTAVQNWIRTNRMRYLSRATIPLQGTTLDPKEWFLNFTNEVFLNFGANTANNVFDQNRTQLNIGRRLNKDVRLEFGFLEHAVLRPNGRQVERNHTLVTTLTTALRLPGHDK